MEELGFEEIFINVHYKSDQIISYLTNLNNPKIKISDETDCLLDTGGGIKKIMDENKIEHVFILNCDNLWKDEDTVFFREMIDSFPKDIMSLLALTPKDLIVAMMVKVIFHLLKMTIYKDIMTRLVKATYLMVLRLLEKKHSKT